MSGNQLLDDIRDATSSGNVIREVLTPNFDDPGNRVLLRYSDGSQEETSYDVTRDEFIEWASQVRSWLEKSASTPEPPLTE